MTPPPETMNVFAATQKTVARPRWAKVRLPVVAVPTRYMVTPEPCVIVWLDAL